MSIYPQIPKLGGNGRKPNGIFTRKSGSGESGCDVVLAICVEKRFLQVTVRLVGDGDGLLIRMDITGGKYNGRFR